ncbi:hypothetical protein [Streptomyces sp. NPDC058247]|uniref:hypothetical protein n=1 Tax=Streptomyces sp. NPDC058247 TaxID=3346401 RepID=UPI0036E2D117
MDQITAQPISFLQWHRDGGLVSVVEYPAGTPRERIATWRERVAANGGAVTEVYAPNPTPPVSAERRAYLRQKMEGARAARLAKG